MGQPAVEVLRFPENFPALARLIFFSPIISFDFVNYNRMVGFLQ